MADQQGSSPAENIANNAWTILLSRFVVIGMPILFAGFIWFCADAYYGLRQEQGSTRETLRQELGLLRDDMKEASTVQIQILQAMADQRADIKILYTITSASDSRIRDIQQRQERRRP